MIIPDTGLIFCNSMLPDTVVPLKAREKVPPMAQDAVTGRETDILAPDFNCNMLYTVLTKEIIG